MKTLIPGVDISTRVECDGPSLPILIVRIKSSVGIESAMLNKTQAEELIRDLQRNLTEM